MPISQNKNNLCASIKDIADAITEHGDLVEVCNIARRTIETLLPCEQVTILRNDDEFQHFAVTPALNQGTPFDRLEILIKYDECSWQTILQTKVPMEINTSTLTEALSGSEISLIGSEPCVCLIVPFNWGHNVLGVIHIVRKDSEYIPNERAQVEEVAALLSLAFERARIYAKTEAVEEASQQWREKYFSLFETVEQALVVVDADIDLIYEANQAVADLTGYTLAELNALPFSFLFAPERAPNLRSIDLLARKENKFPLTKTELLKKDGAQMPVELRIGRIDISSRPRYIVLFSPTDHAESVEPESAEYAEKRPVAPLSFSVDLDSFEDSLEKLASDLGELLSAKYCTVHSVSADNRQFRLDLALEFPRDTAESTDSLKMRLENGPYEKIWSDNQVTAAGSLAGAPDYKRIAAAAKQAGYSGFIGCPLTVGKKRYGVITYFFQDERDFNGQQKRLLQYVAQQIAILYYFTRTKRNLSQKARQSSKVLEIITSLNGLTTIPAIVDHIAHELEESISFDFLSVTLLNYQSENARLFCVASQNFAEQLGDQFQWSQVANSPLLHFQGKTDRDGSDEFNSETSFEDMLGSKISVLLIDKEKYLGNLSLGSLKVDAFSRADVELLRLLAPPASVLLDNVIEGATASSDERPIEKPPTLDETIRELPAQKSRANRDASPSSEDLFSNVQWTAGIIKNAIAALQGYSSMLSDSQPEEMTNGRHFLDKITGTIKQLDQHALGLSDAIRIYSGASRPQHIHSQKLLTEAINNVYALIEKNKIKLEVQSGFPMVHCDPERIIFAFSQIMRIVITLLEGIEDKRIHIGHREAGDNTLFFIRYNGPQPTYSSGRDESTASSEESEVASDPWRFVRCIIETQGGTFSVQAGPSHETEIIFTLPKSEQ